MYYRKKSDRIVISLHIVLTPYPTLKRPLIYGGFKKCKVNDYNFVKWEEMINLRMRTTHHR
jgi:hypothetical protein